MNQQELVLSNGTIIKSLDDAAAAFCDIWDEAAIFFTDFCRARPDLDICASFMEKVIGCGEINTPCHYNIECGDNLNWPIVTTDLGCSDEHSRGGNLIGYDDGDNGDGPGYFEYSR